MLDDILLPTDGSECAEAAMGYAVDLAERYDARLHVCSVLDARRLENAPNYDRVRSDRTDYVDSLCADVDAADTSTVVRTGVPHQEIMGYADESGADLIVMGTHGRTGVERFLLGSVAERVVRLSDTPVMTVRDHADAAPTYPYDDVLVPTDGSEGVGRAVDYGIDLAATYDARLHALSVVDTLRLGVDVRSDTIAVAMEENADSAVEAVAERAEDASVPAVETAVEFGDPSRTIRSYVEDHDVDLIVMGTHGRTGVERYLLGSVAERVIRTAPVPVITGRRGDDPDPSE